VGLNALGMKPGELTELVFEVANTDPNAQTLLRAVDTFLMNPTNPRGFLDAVLARTG
jgi:hypothetical protein